MQIEYDNLYIHFVFVTKDRQPLISDNHRIRIEKYITGVIKNNSCKLYAIYANPEHVHILLSKAPELSEIQISTIIADSSAKFINDNKLCKFRFEWQQSAAAFAVSKSDIDKVCQYILGQPLHHKKVTYAMEYDAFMQHYQQPLRPKNEGDGGENKEE